MTITKFGYAPRLAKHGLASVVAPPYFASSGDCVRSRWGGGISAQSALRKQNANRDKERFPQRVVLPLALFFFLTPNGHAKRSGMLRVGEAD